MTKKLHDWYGAQRACQHYSGADFMTLDSVAKQHVLTNLLESSTSYWVNNRSPWVLKTSIDKHIGAWNQGAGMTMGDIDGNGIPDLIAAYIDDPGPTDHNHIYYRIGWNINEEGKVTEWSDSHDAMDGGGIGWRSQGGGVVVGHINDNTTSDMLFYYIDNPEGQNHGYYRIQFDMEQDGTGGTLGERHSIPQALFGPESEGGGVTLGDINKNGIPDLVVYNIDDPSGENTARYIIGYDLDASGAASYWSDVYTAGYHNGTPIWIFHPLPIGSENEGGGIALADINKNGTLDLIMYYIDNPDGENHPYYYIGWDIGKDGAVSHWSERKRMGPFTLGSHNEGGGIAIGDIDNNGRPDFIPGAIDNPDGENSFQYGVGMNIDKEGNFVTLHLDKNGVLISD